MNPTSVEKNALTVLEAGFKVIPGKEAEFFALQERMTPVAARQPGFLSVQGGIIVGSSWLYFGVRFESKTQMDEWHGNPGHKAVQKMAYEKFWTNVYLRKWRALIAGEVPGDRLMCETRVISKADLSADQLASMQPLLDGLERAGAQRFETTTGEYESHPYQFVAPAEISPAAHGKMYSLITHWRSAEAVAAWTTSNEFVRLRELGEVTNDMFTAIVEDEERDRLRPDRMQRDWALSGHS